MEFLLGFLIALMISLTGVGAGSMTTPLLILLLGVSPSAAVGTALAFGAIVKIASAPVYALRRQVNFRILNTLLLGGIPGVLIGSVTLGWLKNSAYNGVLYIALGGIIVSISLFHLYRIFFPQREAPHKNRPLLLAGSALFIGSEVGFSSAGAGALGSLVLLSFTRLTASEVVGTDLCFGLGLSAVGSLIQVGQGNYDGALLMKLVAGGLCGAIAGGLLSGKIAKKPLRVGLLFALVVLGVQLALHGGSQPAPVLHAMLHAVR